jgi:hypothetical protein
LLEVGYDGKELENPYPTFEGNEGFPAIEKFFGLTERESGDIFSIYGYERAPTPKMVAKKIETFVSQKQKAV